MFELKVNNKYKFEIHSDNEGMEINNKKVDWDIIETGKGRFHIIKDNVSYNAEILEADDKSKTFSINVNGAKYEIVIKNAFDTLLKELGMGSSASSQISEIKAPMPGMVLDIMVKEGQQIVQDTSVLILEAMKMENILKSPGNGTIKNIYVKNGDAVEKNQVLVIIE